MVFDAEYNIVKLTFLTYLLSGFGIKDAGLEPITVDSLATDFDLKAAAVPGIRSGCRRCRRTLYKQR